LIYEIKRIDINHRKEQTKAIKNMT